MIKHFMCAVAILFSTSAFSLPLLPAPSNIELVTGFPPGGWTDVVAREVHQYLEKKLDKPVALQYKVGANGKVAADYALSQPSSKTVFLVVGTGPVMNKVTNSQNFPEFSEFDWVTPVATTPAVMVVNSKLGVSNLKEFVALAKTRKLNCGASNVASHVSGQYVVKKLNLQSQVQVVPFKSSSDLMPQLLGGHVDCGFDSLVVLEPSIKAGQNTLILTGTSVKDYPVKTFNDVESDLQFSLFIGLATPVNSQGAERQQVFEALKQMHKDPAVKDKFSKSRISMPVPGDIRNVQKEFNSFKNMATEVTK